MYVRVATVSDHTPVRLPYATAARRLRRRRRTAAVNAFRRMVVISDAWRHKGEPVAIAADECPCYPNCLCHER